MATFKTVMATFGGVVGYYLGGFDIMLKTLLILVVIDYISGVVASGFEGKLKSGVGYKGIARKMMIFMIIVCANLMDEVLKTGDAFRNAACLFYVSNELLSIVENSARIGLPIPEKLKQAIEVLKSKEGTEDEK